MRRLPTIALAAVLAATMPTAAAADHSTDTDSWGAYETDAYWQNLQANRAAIEWEMVDEINRARARHGLQPLVVQDDIRQIARSWAEHMRDENRQYHNPNHKQQLGGSDASENVWGHEHGGTHVTHRGFMDSYGHRANILRPSVNEVGVGVAFDPDTSKWWYTVNFRHRSHHAPQPPRPSARPVRRDHGVTPVAARVAGDDRVGTALELSRRRDRADTVVVARAGHFADALSGGPLAAANDGPLLLTGRDRLDLRVGDEIGRLGATRAYLLGGTAALSGHVADDLADLGLDVVRLAGQDRFETAAAVARQWAADRGHEYVQHVYVADGVTGWPDALSASAAAAGRGSLLLLVGGGEVPDATADLIGEWAAPNDSGYAQPVTVLVVGGPQAVSDRQVDTLEEATNGGDVWRLAGQTRYATSARAAGLYGGLWPAMSGPGPVWVATGHNWPDALAAGPAAAAEGARVLLVDGHDPSRSPAATAALAGNLNMVEQVVPLGGPAVLSAAGVESLQDRLR